MRYDGTVAGLSVDVPTSGEVPALITLVNSLATEPNFLFINPIDPVNGVAIVRNHLATIAASATEAVLVAHVGADLAGLITGIRGVHPARRGAVDVGLGVRPDWRRRGIGQTLMRALERWARAAGCHRLQLRVTTDNAAAIALYRKCGFVIEGVLYAAASIDGRYYDDLEMAKLLVPGG
jgi:L-phenylalanine/L-methionine N-acetyltransferase